MLESLLRGVTVGGDVGALRILSTYQPVAGNDAKLAPPTYPPPSGAPRGAPSRYLTEERYIDGELTPTVLVDSVQSQGNRTEEALVDAIDAGLLALPVLVTSADIDGVPFRVTSLDAPHRSPDAYFRDSETEAGEAFDDTEVGRSLRTATERNARPLYRASPTDLVLGVWDSQRGGRGLRLPRAYTSEMIGLGFQQGIRAAGRLDPFNIPTAEVYYDEADPSSWSLDQSDLPRGVKSKKGKTSNINHGNALASDAPGGVSVREVRRLAVVSLKVLRRLRFPDGDSHSPEVDRAGRAVLAALALVGDRLAFADSTLYLRSGCDLVLETERAEWVGRGDPQPIELPTPEQAIELLRESVAHAESLGLSFGESTYLRPKANLLSLLRLTFSSPPSDEE